MGAKLFVTAIDKIDTETNLFSDESQRNIILLVILETVHWCLT